MLHIRAVIPSANRNWHDRNSGPADPKTSLASPVSVNVVDSGWAEAYAEELRGVRFLDRREKLAVEELKLRPCKVTFFVDSPLWDRSPYYERQAAFYTCRAHPADGVSRASARHAMSRPSSNRGLPDLAMGPTRKQI